MISGMKIKEIIREKGFRQNFISERVGMKNAAFNHWLQGRTHEIDPKVYKQVAKLLDLHN